MKDYQTIFTKWSSVDTATLENVDDAGARVELALRTNDPLRKKQAVELMDFDTYNVISALEILDKPNLRENMRLYDARLIPAITLARNLDVVTGHEVLLYMTEKLIGNSEGLLQKIIKLLDLLRKKVLPRECNNYIDLLRLHFNDFEICYLNYVWLRQNASDVTLCKLQSNLLNVLFDKEDAFTENDKALIVKVIADHPRRCDDLEWSKNFDCCTVRNDDNWEWLYSLCRKNQLSINCLTIHPLILQDVSRFNKLTYNEKILFIDNDVACAIQDTAIKRMLERLDFEEYYSTLNRRLPVETFANLVKLGILDLEIANVENIKGFVKGINSLEAYLFWKEHPEYHSIEVVQRSKYYLGGADIIKSFLTSEQQRDFISLLLDIYYKASDREFFKILTEVMCCEETVTLYDNELLMSIVKYLAETFKNEFPTYTINRMLKNIMDKDAYDTYVKKKREEEELERLHQEELNTAKAVQQITEAFNNCKSFVEVWQLYNEYKKSYRFKSELVNRVLLETLNSRMHEWEHDEYYTKLYYLMWDSGLVDFEMFKQVTAIKEVS